VTPIPSIRPGSPHHLKFVSPNDIYRLD